MLIPCLLSSISLHHGIKVILREDIRWHRCDIKSIMLLPNVLMIQEAAENGAEECFFIRDGFFTECAHSNIFGIKDGTVVYPSRFEP